MRLSDCSSDVCSSYLKARAVVDLGITPGGWSQVVRKANPRARVAGIDLLPCEPIEGVDILEMDFMDAAEPDALIEATSEERRVGKECARQCKYRWSRDNYQEIISHIYSLELVLYYKNNTHKSH